MAQTPLFAKANVSASSTDSIIVSATAGKSIVVLSCWCIAGATATNLTFNTASTALTATSANGANGGMVLNHNEYGWFRTVPGEALTVTTGSGSSTGVNVNYITI